VTRALRLMVPALVLLAAGSARADGYLESKYQLTTLLSLTWEAGIPIGTLRDFIDATSFRGGQFEARFGVARHLSLGLATSWNWFAQNFSNRTVDFPNATVTASGYDRVQFITLRGTFHWYLLDGPVQPYLGVGAGGVWTGWYQVVADYTTSSNGFAFTADPEVGLLLTVSQGLAVHLLARYPFTLASYRHVENAQWVGVDLGVAVY
jgi:hypothetical protein